MSVFIPVPKKGNVIEFSNNCTVALIPHASKVILKILQARLVQQYVKQELKNVQTGFRNCRGTRDHIANIRSIIEKAREFQKNIYFCFIPWWPAMWKTRVWSMGQEDPLEKEMATHSNILAWRIPWT